MDVFLLRAFLSSVVAQCHSADCRSDYCHHGESHGAVPGVVSRMSCLSRFTKDDGEPGQSQDVLRTSCDHSYLCHVLSSKKSVVLLCVLYYAHGPGSQII